MSSEREFWSGVGSDFGWDGEAVGANNAIDDDKSFEGHDVLECVAATTDFGACHKFFDSMGVTSVMNSTHRVQVVSHNYPTGSTKTMRIARARTSGNTTVFDAFLVKAAGDDNIFKFRSVVNDDGGTTSVTGTADYSPGDWLFFEFEYDIGNDTYEVKLEGSTFTSGSLTSTHPTTIDKWQIGAISGQVDITLYHDWVGWDTDGDNTGFIGLLSRGRLMGSLVGPGGMAGPGGGLVSLLPARKNLVTGRAAREQYERLAA